MTGADGEDRLRLLTGAELEEARRRGIGLLARMLADRWRGGAFPSSYRRQWQGLVDACRSGARSPGATLADGRDALVAALAALESAGQERPVPLPAAGASTRREGAR